VAYQRILQLTYVEELLAALKALFVKLFEPFLTTFVASLHAKETVTSAVASWDFAKAFEGWDKVFDKLLKGLEDKAAQVRILPFPSPPTQETLRIVNLARVPQLLRRPSIPLPQTTSAPVSALNPDSGVC
jgi:hypothetical protein